VRIIRLLPLSFLSKNVIIHLFIHFIVALYVQYAMICNLCYISETWEHILMDLLLL